MSPGQFGVFMLTVVALFAVLGLLVVLLIVKLLPQAVQLAVAARWTNIEAMFDRALAHGGSIDTANRAARSDASAARDLAADALRATELLKDRVDENGRAIKALQEHPLLRPMGGRPVIDFGGGG